MTHSKKQDKQVIDRLREQMRAEKAYQEKFLAARRVVTKREKERESAYDKFKRYQRRNTESDDMLKDYLAHGDRA